MSKRGRCNIKRPSCETRARRCLETSSDGAEKRSETRVPTPFGGAQSWHQLFKCAAFIAGTETHLQTRHVNCDAACVQGAAPLLLLLLLLMGGAPAESLHLVLRRAGPLPRRPEMKTRLGGSGRSDGDGGGGLKGREKGAGSRRRRCRVWQAKPLSAGEPGDNTLMDFNKTPLPHNALYQIKEPRIYMPETASH